MKYPVLLLVSLALFGCALVKRQPNIRSGETVVTAPADAGKAGTLGTAQSSSGVTVPQNTPVEITKTAAVPATETTLFQPEKWEVRFTPTKETRIETASSSVNASTGTVDTSVALKKVQAAEARILLYAALGAAALGGVFFWLKYPTPALICGAAAVVFFLAWKVSDLPSWFWVIGASALVAAAFLYIGHEKGEKNPFREEAS